MKKLFSSLVAVSVLASGAFAYSVKGEPELGFTGYKMAKKDPTDGVFKKFEFNSGKNDNFAEFAKSITIKLDPSGIETKPKLPLRDNRVIAIFKGETIDVKISDVKGDENKGEFTLDINLNGKTKSYNAPYELKDGVLSSSADIDLLDFALNETFAKFVAECKALHGGKSYSDAKVSLKLNIDK